MLAVARGAKLALTQQAAGELLGGQPRAFQSLSNVPAGD